MLGWERRISFVYYYVLFFSKIIVKGCKERCYWIYLIVGKNNCRFFDERNGYFGKISLVFVCRLN